MSGALILGYLFLFAHVFMKHDAEDISEAKKWFRTLYFVGTVAALGYCTDLMVRQVALTFAGGME
jgi:uncharacterized membrane protein